MFTTLKRILLGTAAVATAAALGPIAGPVAGPFIAGMALTPAILAHRNRHRRRPAPPRPVIGAKSAIGPVRIGRLHQTR